MRIFKVKVMNVKGYLEMPNCVLMLTLLMIADGFIVKGPSGPLVGPLGSSVILPCYVDQVLLMEDLKVEWRRTDSETLVHRYQDDLAFHRPEAQQQDYQDRAHFFTDQIQHGNFSLRLDNLRAEDEGKYTCKVHSQQESGEIVAQIKYVERLLVSGSDESISVSVDEDVTLNCSVDSHITPEHIEEVKWIRTDEEILVLLYEKNKTLPNSSDEQYRDRVEFFTDEIPKGNFSLRLKRVRTEDKGVYMCQVFAGGLSANATVVLERLGFSVSHIMVLILCISASGSALLLGSSIYCRSPNKDSFLHLQIILVICSNIITCFAFVLWGVSGESLNESVCCCALYALRPLMLFWAAPYIDDCTGNIKTWIEKYSYIAEYTVFSAVVFSALFASAWENFLNYSEFDRVMINILFAVVFLCCLCKMIYFLIPEIGRISEWIINIFDVVADMIFDVLPALQFILLFFTFGSAREGSDSVIKPVWLLFILLVNAVMIGLYVVAVGNETDPVGWACVMGFLQIVWAVMKFTDKDYYKPIAPVFQRFFPVYVFGSVVVIILNSVILMTEVILKKEHPLPARHVLAPQLMLDREREWWSVVIGDGEGISVGGSGALGTGR